jgi:hypothetical protein
MLTIKLTQPQHEFMSLPCRFPAFIGGFGSGKTKTLAINAIRDALAHPRALIGLYEPTFKLVSDILVPTMQNTLDDFGIKHKYNSKYNTIYTYSAQCGNFKLDTMDVPERIVGYEIYRAHVDELDIMPFDKAKKAWQKIIARCRQKIPAEGRNKASVYTTPEGFKFVYSQWANSNNPDYQYIRAATYTNPYIDDDYIQALKDTYPAELIEAYIEGHFVNLTSGTVYRSFSRTENNSFEDVLDGELLYIGMDFNIDKMAAIVFVKRGDSFHAVREFLNGYDTGSMLRTLKETFPRNNMIIYPDSSGKNRHTSSGASISDIATIRQHRIEARYKETNPFVKDRVAAVNIGFQKKYLYVNVKNCPSLTTALEQQAYDKNGQPDKSQGIDHQLDAFGYVIAYERPINKPVITIPFKFL